MKTIHKLLEVIALLMMPLSVAAQDDKPLRVEGDIKGESFFKHHLKENYWTTTFHYSLEGFQSIEFIGEKVDSVEGNSAAEWPQQVPIYKNVGLEELGHYLSTRTTREYNVTVRRGEKATITLAWTSINGPSATAASEGFDSREHDDAPIYLLVGNTNEGAIGRMNEGMVSYTMTVDGSRNKDKYSINTWSTTCNNWQREPGMKFSGVPVRQEQ